MIDKSVEGILVLWVTKHDRALHADPACPELNRPPGEVEPWSEWSPDKVPHERLCNCAIPLVTALQRAAKRPECVARIWRDGSRWYAELWTPRTATDPPAAEVRIRSEGWPEGVPGMCRRGLSLHSTRWGATRAARRMRERWQQGLPPEPADEPPATFLV